MRTQKTSIFFFTLPLPPMSDVAGKLDNILFMPLAFYRRRQYLPTSQVKSVRIEFVINFRTLPVNAPNLNDTIYIFMNVGYLPQCWNARKTSQLRWAPSTFVLASLSRICERRIAICNESKCVRIKFASRMCISMHHVARTTRRETNALPCKMPQKPEQIAKVISSVSAWNASYSTHLAFNISASNLQRLKPESDERRRRGLCGKLENPAKRMIIKV